MVRTYIYDAIDVEGLDLCDALVELQGHDVDQVVHDTWHKLWGHGVDLGMHKHQVHEDVKHIAPYLGGLHSLVPIKVTHLHPMLNDPSKTVTLVFHIHIKDAFIQRAHFSYDLLCRGWIAEKGGVRREKGV